MLDVLGGSRRDRVLLISTLRSLGATSVPGLAAALSWSEGRTVRTLRAVTRHAEAPIEFDPHRRFVRIASPPTNRVTSPPSPGRPPSNEAPPRHEPLLPPATPAASPARTSPPAPPANAPRCPSCHARLSAAGLPGLYVCPDCGALHHQDREPPTPAVPAAALIAALTPASKPTAPPSPPTPGSTVEDRRGQELFAAWVTAQPIPCPKCRTPLRHRGVGEYGCPSCGTHVRFDLSGTVSRISGPTVRMPAQ